MAETPTRGERDHNPFNLEDFGIKWQGLADPPHDDDNYCVFVDDIHGIRAGAKDLHNKWKLDGLKTIRAIITKFAPPADNDTPNYIAAMASTIGKKPDDTSLDLDDPDQLYAACCGAIHMENGRIVYSPGLIRQGVAEALAGDALAPPAEPAPAA